MQSNENNLPNPDNGGSSAIVVEFLLAVLFSCIVFFLLFFICNIQEQNAFVPIFIFSIIDLFILFGVTLGGGKLRGVAGVPSYISIVTFTGIYLIIQYVHFFIIYENVQLTTYILFKLISLFAYIAITFIITLVGSKH